MLNQPIPDFELPATSGQTFRLSHHAGTTLVLYFYPRDATPGCTAEGQQFRDLHAAFVAAGSAVFGISRDALPSHEKFRERLRLPFALLADTGEIACQLFDVIKMKNLYGKQVRGIERSTFVVDAAGVLRREWRGVKPIGHAQEVLEFIHTLQETSRHG